MNLRQLQYFRTIVEEGQITRAAKVLNMAQPPLSQQLKLLEEELGTTLIIRNNKQWELTDPGKLLYQRAVELLSLSETTKKEIMEFSNEIRGTLSIGISTICIPLLPYRIKNLKNLHPGLYFKLLLADGYYLEELLEKREIELALTMLPTKLKEVKILRLPKEPLIIVIPANWNEVFPGDTVSLREIIHHPLILLRRIKGKGMYEEIIGKFYEYGLLPKVIIECTDILALLTLVSLGVGLTIIPSFSINPIFDNKISIKYIQETFLEKEPAVVWMKDKYLSKAAEKFLETFRF